LQVQKIFFNITNITNIFVIGEHKKMEREREKKKAPGKAVIMTGTNSHPPTHDNDMGNAKEYVMQYTGMVDMLE